MKQKRYTQAKFFKDVERFNGYAETDNLPIRFMFGAQMGVTFLYIGTTEDLESYTMSRTIKLGTPRECLEALEAEYNYQYRIHKAKEK